MNTADRSVALIDAAMRRRFHFVPFFPHDGPMKGLLRRWLADGGGRAGVADLLDAVNQELLSLVGEHLLIGPSHFMKTDLSGPGPGADLDLQHLPAHRGATVGRPGRDRPLALGPGQRTVRRRPGREAARRSHGPRTGDSGNEPGSA